MRYFDKISTPFFVFNKSLAIICIFIRQRISAAHIGRKLFSTFLFSICLSLAFCLRLGSLFRLSAVLHFCNGFPLLQLLPCRFNGCFMLFGGGYLLRHRCPGLGIRGFELLQSRLLVSHRAVNDRARHVLVALCLFHYGIPRRRSIRLRILRLARLCVFRYALQCGFTAFFLTCCRRFRFFRHGFFRVGGTF